MLAYPIGASGQILVLTDEVLAHFRLQRQTRPWHREAGGQLFARFDADRILLVEATGPRPSDRRCRMSYLPDRVAEQQEIDERFPQGLHFVGDWHTHPEDRPSPSTVDLRSTADGFWRSRHSLHAFLMVIVGRAYPPSGLHVSLTDAHGPHVLQPQDVLTLAFPDVQGGRHRTDGSALL